MRIRVTVLADGHGPSEKLIGVRTSSGQEQLIVSHRVLQSDTIDVGLGLSFERDNVLVELPRESTSGRWRVWVPESEIIDAFQHAE